MTKELKALKNPYYRHLNNIDADLPVENPLKELTEDEMGMFGSGAAEPRTITANPATWGVDYIKLSIHLGNNGNICTYTVECQKNCN